MSCLSALFGPRRPPPDQALPSALFPTHEYTMSVNAWANHVRDMVENQACRLRRIVHCKVTSGARDEFLVVYVRHPSGKEAVALVDRDTSFDPPSAYPDEDPAYVRAVGATPSRDRVRVSAGGSESLMRHLSNGGWAEIHTVTFPKASEAPSVAHLAVLLAVVHRHGMAPGTSSEMRSGWFAYCVGEVMKETFLGTSKGNKGWVRAPFGGMKVEGRDTVDALIREFKPAWDDFSRRQTTRGGRAIERRPKDKTKKTEPFVEMMRTMNL